jgi:hypothetical protein
MTIQYVYLPDTHCCCYRTRPVTDRELCGSFLLFTSIIFSMSYYLQIFGFPTFFPRTTGHDIRLAITLCLAWGTFIGWERLRRIPYLGTAATLILAAVPLAAMAAFIGMDFYLIYIR